MLFSKHPKQVLMEVEYDPTAIAIEPRVLDADFDSSILLNVDTDCAYISGAVVAGYGNPSSDVDIYIISEKNPDLPSGMKFAYYVPDRGYYNEIVLYYYPRLLEIIEGINNLTEYAIKERLKEGHPFFDELEVYYRITIGVPLINRTKFENISRLADNKHIKVLLLGDLHYDSIKQIWGRYPYKYNHVNKYLGNGVIVI